MTVDDAGIFNVYSEAKTSGEQKIAIKNGGLNFGGGYKSSMNVKLDLSSFVDENITIGFTVKNNTGSTSSGEASVYFATGTGSSSIISDETLTLAANGDVGTLEYTIDVEEGNTELYILTTDKIVMTSFWILVNEAE